MAGLKDSDVSPFADALLLAALFLPVLPIVLTLDVYLLRKIIGCEAVAPAACSIAGVNLDGVYASVTRLLNVTAQTLASGFLLIYMALVTLLTQFTIKGFRGRVVRTCAVIMWSGVLPLILGFAAALITRPVLLGVNPLTEFAQLGQVFIHWLTSIAVPLAVLVTGLLAMTLGYRMLIQHIVAYASRKR